MAKSLDVVLLFDSPFFAEWGYGFTDEFESPDWNTERDVYRALLANGHAVRLVGLCNSIAPLLSAVNEKRPDVIYNLAEVFNQQSHLEKNVAALLEMLEIPFTGASAGALFVANDKALSKKILNYHRIKVPHFQTLFKGRKLKAIPKKLRLPLIVKPLCEEGSRGISQSSVVDNEEAFLERVRFIHETMSADAIVEEFIPGREFYVGAMGGKRVTVFSPTEMVFENMTEEEPRIATYKAKWDEAYRKKWGIKNVVPTDVPDAVMKEIKDTVKRAYQALGMRGYARFDMRVTKGGRVFIIEANANPCIAHDEDFAIAAAQAEIPYTKLIQKIVEMALE